MAEEEQAADEAGEESGGGKKKLILLIVIGLLLVGVSVGGTIFAMKFLEEPAAEMAEGEGAEEMEGEGEDAEASMEKMPAIYFPLKPPFIINFDSRGRARFLQASVSVMARDQAVIDAIQLHMPLIRNSIVMMLSAQDFEELRTAEGKEFARQLALQEIQKILEQEIGDKGIEQALFTDFVMQ